MTQKEITICDVTGKEIEKGSGIQSKEVVASLPGDKCKITNLDFHVDMEFLKSMLEGLGVDVTHQVKILFNGTKGEAGEYFLGDPIAVCMVGKSGPKYDPYVIPYDCSEYTMDLCNAMKKRLDERGHRKGL